ncbi:Prefoldin subunit 2 [Hondaea fermentalgiana]|uniref:Prefoldin subunit 2 n=1 Tax=Hondaea fermentalgiana TaxID=2315210 RepID=A0A2R5GJ28_9STRA|nr:Prefoldin subunit 2 [Hondaea fermentalgiana]|eukprot:GBG30890.1 Prefoldin subunit 2 [Hondaea fermentalgiana]
MDPNAVRAEFEKLANEAQMLRNRVAQLEAEEREHIVAAEVLDELSGERQCYRLVGDVLVEKTRDEALMSVRGNMERIQKQIELDTNRSLEIEKEVKAVAAKTRGS